MRASGEKGPLAGIVFAAVSTGFEAIREQLAERRSAGQPFEEAWLEVTGAVETADRRILAQTREAWQQAYEVVQAPRA